MTKKKRHKKPQKATTPPKQDLGAALRSRHGFEAREFLHIGVIFAVALAIRLIFFFVNKQTNPLFNDPILDSLFHHQWAKEINDGNFWGDEVYFRAPLYPYFLAFLYKISGTSIAFATFCQHLI